jgi:NAD(P)-dependent dehydrogenase (short-subunit alcohol dehydrogenase family)
VLYETAKAGIEGMTRALARELGPDDIRVTCVVPGNVKTKRQEKWYTPEGEAEIVKAQCLKGRLNLRFSAFHTQLNVLTPFGMVHAWKTENFDAHVL